MLKSPSRTFEESWDEIIKRGAEVPPGALIRVYVYDEPIEIHESQGGYQGRSLADVLVEIGGVDNLPPDMSEHPEKYMGQFGKTRDARKPES